MKYLFLIFTILISNFLFAQTDTEIYNLTKKAVQDRAQHFKVDQDILQAVIVAYIEPDTVGYVLATEKGMVQKGTIWEVVHRTAKFMAIKMKTRSNCSDNINCWKHTYFSFIDIIPEHPLIDTEHYLKDTGKGYFQTVPVVTEKNFNIEEPITITCDPDDKSSICDWMKEQKKSSSEMYVEQLNKESGEYRQDLNDAEYNFRKSLEAMAEISLNQELNKVDEIGTDPVLEALEKQWAQLLQDNQDLIDIRDRHGTISLGYK